MQYIYSRVSTEKQVLENQISKLRTAYPEASVYEEIAGGSKHRPILEELLTKLERGDTLVIAALDRLGRTTIGVLTIIEDLEKRGVILKSLREGIDYSTIAGRLVTRVLVSVAEMEREIISERTKDALAARKKAGVILGRPRTHAEDKCKWIRELRSKGLTFKSISAHTGVSTMQCWQICKREKS